MSAATTSARAPVDLFAGVASAVSSFRSQVQQGDNTLRALTDRVRNAATATDRLRSATSPVATRLRALRTNTDAAARSVTRTGQTATGAVTGVRSAGTNARTGTRSLGRLRSGLGGVLAVVGGLIGAAGIVGGLLSTFGTAMGIGSGVMTAINILTRANPIGFVTGLLLPVAGWLLDLAMNSEAGQRFMEQLSTLVLKYVELYVTIMGPLLKMIGTAVSTYVTGYLAVIRGALTGIAALITTGFAVLRALTTGDTRALSGKVSAVWRGFKDAVGPALKWISQDIPRMFTRIKEALSGAMRGLGQFVTTGAQTVAGVIKGPVNGLIAFANWIVDGLNSLSFSLFGKKFGVDLDKIPMLAEGGVAIPGATRRAGKVLPLTALHRQQALALRNRNRPQPPHRITKFHESRGAGAHGTAEDLLFLAAAHARTPA
ncbi:tape-measure protein [Streptomyces sp. NPDC002888]|uniref:tape-measure protein n=1 Tax=Streptomyces sp. NPDC002888 TaxID=3364668 RepID=UPI0036ADED99